MIECVRMVCSRTSSLSAASVLVTMMLAVDAAGCTTEHQLPVGTGRASIASYHSFSRSPAVQTSRRCPKALSGGAHPGEHALRTTRLRLANIFRGIDVRGAILYAAISLSPVGSVPALGERTYTTRPLRACGRVVVGRSWVVLVRLPDAPMASLYPALVYLVRTREGWRPWYLSFPNFGTAELISG